MNRIPPIALVAVLGLALSVSSGCSNDETGPSTTPTPVGLRTVSPPDSSIQMHDPLGVTLTAVMTRDVTPADFRQNWIVPAPLSRGTFRVPGTRTVEWPDVVLDPDVAVHTWFLDGPDFPAPVVLTYYARTPDEETGVIRGAIRIRDDLRSAKDAMVFVLPLAAQGERIPEGSLSFLGLPVVRAIRLGPGIDVLGNFGPSSYRIEDLVADARYVLLAIEDTDDDGYYVPGVDWWGYPRRADRPDDIIPVTARDAGRPIEFDDNATFSIDRPGALQPDDF